MVLVLGSPPFKTQRVYNDNDGAVEFSVKWSEVDAKHNIKVVEAHYDLKVTSLKLEYPLEKRFATDDAL